jgi:hypothetical protein
MGMISAAHPGPIFQTAKSSHDSSKNGRIG